MGHSAKRWGRIGLIAAFMVALCGASMNLNGSSTTGGTQQGINQQLEHEELLLVRSWDPKSGELIGWLPLHRLAITLQQVGPEALSLDLNDAVTMKLPTRPGEFDSKGVRVAPEPLTFQGQKWLPVEREPNLVRIKKSLFYVKSIVFGESKYRSASKTP